MLMGLRMVSIAHTLNSTAGPQHRTVRSKSNHFCGTCPAPSQPSSSCIFDLFGEHVNLPGHALFFQSRLALYFSSEWAVPAKEVTHCGYSCLPLEYKGLVKCCYYFESIFFLLSFWDTTIKKNTTRYMVLHPFFGLLLFNQEVYSDWRAPHLQVLHAPLLPKTAELQDGEGHPRASVGGGVSRPRLVLWHCVSRFCCVALQPPYSQCLWSVSSGVTWALEACLRNIMSERQWRRLYIKTWQKILMIAI